jgi:rhodanese-related sulfurtransferase
MKEINAKEALKLVEAGEAELCDVRTREEWQEDGLPELDNLLKITWQGDPQGFLDELNEKSQGKKIIFLCLSGIRSSTTATLAAQAGYDSYNLTGGFKAWKASLLPIKK